MTASAVKPAASSPTRSPYIRRPNRNTKNTEPTSARADNGLATYRMSRAEMSVKTSTMDLRNTRT